MSDPIKSDSPDGAVDPAAICSLLEEIDRPLNEVSRAWIRRPVTIILWPLVAITAALAGIVDGTKAWFRDCW